ncbi:MAG: potassium-transporting ATPase subunit KdpA [Clostridia bacterium]
MVMTIISDVLFLVLLISIGYLFGKSFYKIYNREKLLTSKFFDPIEKVIYKAMGVDENEEMSPKKYALNVLLFSAVSFVGLFALLMTQSLLTLNPNDIDGMSWHLAFNTAASFVTNTNWQAYLGETQLSYLSQMIGLTVQNFVSGSVGIAVLFALFRGFINKEKKTIGNFWVDLTKITLQIMLPVCFVGAIFLVSQGVPQSFNGSLEYVGLEGKTSNLYFGAAASQVIIKQLFTNGGGFFGTNSAFPFENPTAFSNLVQCLSILVIPVGLCFTFGMAVKDKKQGAGLLKAMTIIFVVCVVACAVFEFVGVAKYDGVMAQGNLEGKETRFGIGGSALWAVVTTAASNGSVNAMMDSFTGLGGMVPLLLMMLGEVVYGGVGSGLYGMIGFAILTVFIGGLMVGRTPEYIGKKIGSFDMKMVCLIILPPVLCTLFGTALTVMLPQATSWLTNRGAHGFSEILYAFTSMGNNNGSAFAGFNANTPWTNVVGGISMIIVRFVPMIAVIFLSGSLSKKKIIPTSDGTLSTTNKLFIGMLIAVILIIGLLSFFPALSLSVIADHIV